jgi:tetratricopeptide (TPR) repeat protein
LLLSQGLAQEAVPHLEYLPRLRPKAQTHYYLALALDAAGRAKEAVEHYREAVRLQPQVPLFLNDLAWILATSSRDDVRSSGEAIKLAEQACALAGNREPRFWGTLDAAYANADRFEDAIKTATKTHELALAAKQQEIAQAAEQRLALYRASKPYRSGAPDPNQHP